MTSLLKSKAAFKLIIALIALLPSLSIAAAEMSDLSEEAAKGKILAVTHCGKCHAIADEKESPLPAAPLFKTFNEKWPLNYLEEALAEGIVTGHTDMPEFQFEPEELGQLLAYIETLKDK